MLYGKCSQRSRATSLEGKCKIISKKSCYTSKTSAETQLPHLLRQGLHQEGEEKEDEKIHSVRTMWPDYTYRRLRLFLNAMSCLQRRSNQYCESSGQHEISNAVVVGVFRGLAPETVREIKLGEKFHID